MINQDKQSKKTLFVVIFRPWNLLQSIFRPWKPLFTCSFCQMQKLDFSSFSTFLAQKRYFWIEFSNKNWYTGSPYSLEYLLKFLCRLGIIFMGFWTKNLKIDQNRPKNEFHFWAENRFFWNFWAVETLIPQMRVYMFIIMTNTPGTTVGLSPRCPEGTGPSIIWA